MTRQRDCEDVAALGAPALADPGGSEAEALLEAVGTAFSKLRRRAMSVPLDPPIHRQDLRRDLALSAVEESPDGLSVGELSDKLMIDAPAASRQAARLVEDGYLLRVASQADARRIHLHLTDLGAHALSQTRHQQREAFEYLTREWPTCERLELARLLIKYTRETAPEARVSPALGSHASE